MNRVRIQSTVDQPLKDRVDAFARRRGLSHSKAVETLVKAGLAVEAEIPREWS